MCSQYPESSFFPPLCFTHTTAVATALARVTTHQPDPSNLTQSHRPFAYLLWHCSNLDLRNKRFQRTQTSTCGKSIPRFVDFTSNQSRALNKKRTLVLNRGSFTTCSEEKFHVPPPTFSPTQIHMHTKHMPCCISFISLSCQFVRNEEKKTKTPSTHTNLENPWEKPAAPFHAVGWASLLPNPSPQVPDYGGACTRPRPLLLLLPLHLLPCGKPWHPCPASHRRRDGSLKRLF